MREAPGAINANGDTKKERDDYRNKNEQRTLERSVEAAHERFIRGDQEGADKILQSIAPREAALYRKTAGKVSVSGKLGSDNNYGFSYGFKKSLGIKLGFIGLSVGARFPEQKVYADAQIGWVSAEIGYDTTTGKLYGPEIDFGPEIQLGSAYARFSVTDCLHDYLSHTAENAMKPWVIR